MRVTPTYHPHPVLQQTCVLVDGFDCVNAAAARTFADDLEDLEVLVRGAFARAACANCLKARAHWVAGRRFEPGQVHGCVYVARHQQRQKLCLRWRRRRADRAVLGGCRRRGGTVQRLICRSCTACSKREGIQLCLAAAVLRSRAAVLRALHANVMSLIFMQQTHGRFEEQGGGGNLREDHTS